MALRCGAVVAALAGASAVLGQSVKQVVPQPRHLQSGEVEGLCGGAATITGDAPGLCSAGANTFGLGEWDPCCALDVRSVENEDKCRRFELGGAYCNETRGEDCSTLSSSDKWEFSISFKHLAEDVECCSNCVCFGDPECVSFNNVEDLWIPCDAREDPFNPTPEKSYKSCRIFKDICDGMTDPNGNQCKWIREDGDNSAGWDMGTLGSPCVPDLSKDDITMNMYTSKDNKFSVDLSLGERGIIQRVNTKIGNSRYSLDANDCFEDVATGGNPWTGGESDYITLLHNSTTEVEYQVVDVKSMTSMHLLCVRNHNGAAPRVNVQSLTVLTEDVPSGSGFCVRDSINEAGDTSDTLLRHHECVATAEEALQACKALVSAGLVDNQLLECATEWCSRAQFADDVDKNKEAREECKRRHNKNDGNNNNVWVSEYCKAVRYQGFSTMNQHNCEDYVKSEGWPVSVEQWTNGMPVAGSPALECGNSLSEYTLDQKEDCVDGVYVEVDMDDTDGEDWVAKYFIPATRPPCEGVVLGLTADDDKDFFIHNVRITQCDPVAEEACLAPLVATCSKTPGADFEVAFSNTVNVLSEELVDLYNKGLLQCNGGGSWCFKDSEDYTNSDLCPCPEN
mmetsp:Transcript_11551/g.20478  ORF Transcript_11551/g.20478 Transcript_11551/m.20478 type:complete len:623 (+) Transcript_11551:475-2343(+)